MFDSSVVDFCIGMAFFYLILTLVCTMINEYIIQRWRGLRSKTLLEGISGLFYDAQKVVELYRHPLIEGLYRDDKKQPQQPGVPETNQGIASEGKMAECRKPFEDVMKYLPSYIPARTFSAALLDILARPADGKVQTWEDLRKAIVDCQNSRIKGALLPLIDAAHGNVEKARQNIEKWYDDTMDRVSGWFKRNARRWLLAVAAVICILLNVDTITVGKMLWQDKGLRDTFVAEAVKYEPKATAGAASGDFTTRIKADMDELSPFPLGWVYLPKQNPANGTQTSMDATRSKDPREIPCGFWPVLLKLIGLFFSTLAISFGAPFWIDLLNSFVNLRGTGKVPLKTEESKA